MKTKCCNTSHFIVSEKNCICINECCENYLGLTLRVVDYKKIRRVSGLAVFTFFVLFSFDDFSMENKVPEVHFIKAELNAEIPLTAENLQQHLQSQNILCAKQVFAQLKLESGNLTSYLLKRTNNLGAMRYPFNRNTTAIGMYIPARDTIVIGSKKELMKFRTTQNYAVYACWTDAVEDYRLWQEKYFNVTKRYLDFLGKNYAEDSLYVKKIKQNF
jgi:hypothetical protein